MTEEQMFPDEAPDEVLWMATRVWSWIDGRVCLPTRSQYDYAGAIHWHWETTLVTFTITVTLWDVKFHALRGSRSYRLVSIHLPADSSLLRAEVDDFIERYGALFPATT